VWPLVIRTDSGSVGMEQRWYQLDDSVPGAKCACRIPGKRTPLLLTIVAPPGIGEPLMLQMSGKTQLTE